MSRLVQQPEKAGLGGADVTDAIAQRENHITGLS
jgi:hypothetical protein